MELIIKSSHILYLELERRIYIGLLYIINDKKYLEYYKKGLIRHMPEFLLPKIKPNIIDDIIKNESLIGKIAGINIKPIEFNDEKELEKYIIGIRNIKTENCTNLYIEDHKYISDEILEYIENTLDMNISKGISTKIFHVPLIIKKIYTLLREDLGEKEVLILSEDKEILKKIIKGVSKDLKLITAIGYDNKYENEIYEYILEETGLSLFCSSNINKILGNYSIIINLMKDFNLDIEKIKRNCLIFDFSRESLAKKEARKSNKIGDFVFQLEDTDINKMKWIEKDVHSDLYESLNGNCEKDISYLSCENDYYTIGEYVNLFMKHRGKL
jgi:hypothetical protein